MRKLTAIIATLFVLTFLAYAQEVNTPWPPPGGEQQTPPPPSRAQEQPRIYITDSQSWETHSSSGGTWGAYGSASSGGARPQTAEIIKTFGERCPSVLINNIHGRADYVVVLDHEGGKSVFQHRNKVAVFERISGDAVMSKSTLSLGASVQEACNAITRHWPANISRMQQAADAEQPVRPLASQTMISQMPGRVMMRTMGTRLRVSSEPDGADIEVDGDFVGNTPSTIEAQPGDHSVVVKKRGFKIWERKIKLSGGDIRLNAELEKD
jgi:hypothetical protein